MDVVEDQDERSISSGCLEESPDRPERLFTRTGIGYTHHLRDVPADLILMFLALENRTHLRLDDLGKVEVG